MSAAFGIVLTSSGCSPPEATAPAVAASRTDAPAAEPVSADAPSDLIPPRYRGEWNRVPADCGTARNDSRLILSGDRVRFHESSGRVMSTKRKGDNEVDLAVEMIGEGERWTAHYRFRLSPDGRELMDVGNGSGWVRHRCE